MKHWQIATLLGVAWLVVMILVAYFVRAESAGVVPQTPLAAQGIERVDDPERGVTCYTRLSGQFSCVRTAR